MTTYRSGHEPASSPASWYYNEGTCYAVAPGVRIECDRHAADRICRAFHVEALARAYMAADTFADADEKRAALFEALR